MLSHTRNRIEILKKRGFPAAPVWELGGGDLGVPPKSKTKVKMGYLWYLLISITWISKITFYLPYIATLSDTHKLTQCVLTIHDKDILYIYILMSLTIALLLQMRSVGATYQHLFNSN